MRLGSLKKLDEDKTNKDLKELNNELSILKN